MIETIQERDYNKILDVLRGVLVKQDNTLLIIQGSCPSNVLNILKKNLPKLEKIGNRVNFREGGSLEVASVSSLTIDALEGKVYQKIYKTEAVALTQEQVDFLKAFIRCTKTPPEDLPFEEKLSDLSHDICQCFEHGKYELSERGAGFAVRDEYFEEAKHLLYEFLQELNVKSKKGALGALCEMAAEYSTDGDPEKVLEDYVKELKKKEEVEDHLSALKAQADALAKSNTPYIMSEGGIDYVKAIINGSYEFSYIHSRLSKEDKQKIIDSTVERYGESYFVGSQEEADNLINQGEENVKVIDSDVATLINDSGLYIKVVVEGEKPSAWERVREVCDYIQSELDAVLSDNSSEKLRVLEALEKLQDESSNWSN